MILGQSIDKLKVVCFGGGGVGGQGFNETSEEEKETLGRQAAGNEAAAKGIGFAGTTGGGGMKGTSAGVASASEGTQDVVSSEIDKAEGKASAFSNVRKGFSLVAPMNPIAQMLDMFLPNKLSNRASFGLNAGAKGVDSPDIRGGGMTPGIAGNFGAASEGIVDDWLQSKPVSAHQGTAQNSVPVSQKETQANPEEAAANAAQDEKKKARQRVGLMQMRNIDPLFMEGLPDIFRSKAR